MYKLFVGGITQDTTEDDILQYFSRFGVFTDALIVYDKVSSSLRLSRNFKRLWIYFLRKQESIRTYPFFEET